MHISSSLSVRLIQETYDLRDIWTLYISNISSSFFIKCSLYLIKHVVFFGSYKIFYYRKALLIFVVFSAIRNTWIKLCRQNPCNLEYILPFSSKFYENLESRCWRPNFLLSFFFCIFFKRILVLSKFWVIFNLFYCRKFSWKIFIDLSYF